jgi:peptidoglycan/LPS O-acetylase OafA/YrhL
VTAAVAGYARFIDGLRAIAVLAVIAYHFDAPLLPGGFTGVDVFFVISGFVVSLSVSGLDGIGLPAFAGFFYARRLFRIAPALIVGFAVRC